MDELQGLNLINKEGYYQGIIERNFYSQNVERCIIYYKKDNLEYKKTDMTKEEFLKYSTYAKLKSDRYEIIKKKNINHLYHFLPIQKFKYHIRYIKIT